MYVTRPLSMFKNSPADLSLPPPEGPNSGILVVQDEEATCCFGLFNSEMIKDMPLPQNKNLELYYATGFYPNRNLRFHKVLFIPVLNQPLSSNRYYAIYPYGKDRGEGYTSSKEEDLEMDTCCSGGGRNDVLPQHFDPRNLHQQYEIHLQTRIINVSGGFVAKSMAQDGFPPEALWRKGWKLKSSTLQEFELGDAPGLDTALRARLPDFNFPLKPVVVGKWYCPFMFVKEGTPKSLRDERTRSMYYEMTLEQKWEQIFARDHHSNHHDQSNAVAVDAVVQSEVVMVAGREAVCDERSVGDGVMEFRSLNNVGEETRVGVSLAIVERMEWEQGRVGWVGGDDEGLVRVERVEEYGGKGEWNKFGCFALTERFALKRMDGSLVFTHDFKHTHQIRSKWE
ncbi:hypothetical protein GBA52_002702 [Prunus armeniaca]|nr:hypothetical protein GBA52_002702 [Prunus armeniaca]